MDFFFSLPCALEPDTKLPNLLLTGSPLPSPLKTDESFDIDLDRSRNEFNQFNQDLDEIAHSMEKLFEDAPVWLANIEEIKRNQDSVEECILATQEKIYENENRLENLKSLQCEDTEDINNDLKKIQEQIFDILEKHRCARSNVANICNNQSRTTEQLDLMLQAIHEYARLIQEASLTIKHFDDVGSPLKYESLDLSPFRHYKFLLRRPYLSSFPCKYSRAAISDISYITNIKYAEFTRITKRIYNDNSYFSNNSNEFRYQFFRFPISTPTYTSITTLSN